MMRLLTVFLFLMLGSNAFAAGLTEPQKIDALLDALGTSDVTFIRHEKEFTAAQGKEFLSDKYHGADPKVTTAKGFIVDVATGGKITGQPFFIKTKDGKKVESAKWFTDQLAIIEKNSGKTPAKPAAKAADKK